MIRYFYLSSVILFLWKPCAFAQNGVFKISGQTNQPKICVQKHSTVYGDRAELDTPRMYLIEGCIPSQHPVAGAYETSGDQLCFEPLYPLAAGSRFLLQSGNSDTVFYAEEKVNSIPAERAVVSNFYPLSDSIPENILFFHVRFTQAMKEDQHAWKKIAIADQSGAIISGTWRQRSFWLDSGRLLVLMIHPGRVKSGIHYTGPVFTSGKEYIILVDSSIEDQYNRPLGKSASRHYQILPGQKEILKPLELSTKVKAGTSDPIIIRFANDVDHAAAITGIQVYNANAMPIPCTVQQKEYNTIVVYPEKIWPYGKLHLKLSGALYDCAGNRMNRLFEMKNSKRMLDDDAAKEFIIPAE